jgi:hypothetical protein
MHYNLTGQGLYVINMYVAKYSVNFCIFCLKTSLLQ